jgi:hypothetical protein
MSNLTDELAAAAERLEVAMREYINTGFTGLAFHQVTNCRRDLAAAVAAYRAATSAEHGSATGPAL